MYVLSQSVMWTIKPRAKKKSRSSIPDLSKTRIEYPLVSRMSQTHLVILFLAFSIPLSNFLNHA